jgi:hypothetical protein
MKSLEDKDANYNEEAKKLKTQYKEREKDITERWELNKITTKEANEELRNVWNQRCKTLKDIYDTIFKENKEYSGQGVTSSSQESSCRLASSEESQQLRTESGRFQIETMEGEKIVLASRDSVEKIKNYNMQYYAIKYGICENFKLGMFDDQEAIRELGKMEENYKKDVRKVIEEDCRSNTGLLDPTLKDEELRTDVVENSFGDYPQGLSEDYSKSFTSLPQSDIEASEFQISDAKSKEIPLESVSESESHEKESWLPNMKYNITNVQIPWRQYLPARLPIKLPLDKLFTNRWLSGWKDNTWRNRYKRASDEYRIKRWQERKGKPE